MTKRERIRTIVAGQPADRVGFWMGAPHQETWPIYHAYFGTTSELELRERLGDDFRQFYAGGCYRHPQGKVVFDWNAKRSSHPDGHPFADCTDVKEVEDFEWSDPDYLDFSETVDALNQAGDIYRASGMWAPFYHNIMNMFSMEEYLIKMYTHPQVVHALTDRICQFYYDANERFYRLVGDRMDGYFFGNDFGTQLDLICGPEQFDEFILPWFRQLTDQAHRHGYQVILHSCGSIYKVIDRLIAAGVDCLHPLQARAQFMEATRLAGEFKNRIAFMGGIDTQQLLVHATPAEVTDEVRRIKKLYGPCWIVSPSHETLLPNVPPQNVQAMADAARE